MRARLGFVALVVSLTFGSCYDDNANVLDAGATARSRTISVAATQGAARVTVAERVRDELTDALNRARSFQSGLLMLRLQVTGSALSEEAERSAQQSVLAACDEWPGELELDLWPTEYLEFYAAAGASCAAVATVLAALRDDAVEAATVRELWQNVVTDLTVGSGFDIQLGLMLARLPNRSATELLQAIQERQ